MALRTPPSWLQNGSHTAENDRLAQQAILSTSGVVGSASLNVAPNSPTGMSVLVASGYAGIVGTYQSNMGVYTVVNDATTQLTVTTADPTNPRIDRVVVTIADSAYTGVSNTATLSVIAGTPASSPTAPAVPTNAISLATIAVAAATTAITSGNITDTRAFVNSNLVSQGITLNAGTASRAPIALTAGTTLTTQTNGAVEYDGTVAYFTPSTSASATANGGRGTIQTTHYYQLTGTRSLSAGNNTAQSLFGVGINLAASTTYEVDSTFRVSYTVTSPNVPLTFQMGGTAPTAINLQVDYTSNTTGFTTAGTLSSVSINAVSTAVTLNTDGSVTTYYVTARVKGTIRTNTATAYTPQLVFTGNTTFSSPTVQSDSYIKVTPLTTSTATTVGAWS